MSVDKTINSNDANEYNSLSSWLEDETIAIHEFIVEILLFNFSGSSVVLVKMYLWDAWIGP